MTRPLLSVCRNMLVPGWQAKHKVQLGAARAQAGEAGKEAAGWRGEALEAQVPASSLSLSPSQTLSLSLSLALSLSRSLSLSLSHSRYLLLSGVAGRSA